MHKLTLIKRVIILFPRRSYISERSVRHARREYCKAVEYLRGTKWAALYDDATISHEPAPAQTANKWDIYLK